MKVCDFDFHKEVGKNVRVTCIDGTVTYGKLYGHCYDIDDDGTEYISFDLVMPAGWHCGMDEPEVEDIEVAETYASKER